MFQSRFILALGTLALTGVAAAAIAPFAQEMPSPVVDQHKTVLKGVGEWEGTLAMSFPDMPETTSECTETVTAIGELWTVSHFESTFEMMGQTVPFSGSSTFGYDTEKNKFTGTWVDSVNARMTLMEGTQNEETGAIDMTYEAPHPMTQEMTPHRISTNYGEDGYKSEFFMTVDGEEAKTMTIEMKRKK